MKVKFEVLELEKDELVSILSGFMSYSNYWCGEVTWKDEEYAEAKAREIALLENCIDEDVVSVEDIMANMLLNGKSLIIKDEEGEFEDAELTLENLRNGLNLSIENDLISLDIDDWDAADCDIIIQNAIFNEVVYG